MSAMASKFSASLSVPGSTETPKPASVLPTITQAARS